MLALSDLSHQTREFSLPSGTRIVEVRVRAQPSRTISAVAPSSSF
jgi:hypothetical protein